MKVANFFNKLFGSIAPNIDWKNIPTATYVRYILMIIATAVIFRKTKQGRFG